jgi:DNA repair exonuclease SbcCD ATPase subunit
MSKLTDRISFLKGMAAGMKLNMEKDSNKLMLEMLTVMGEMAEEMAAMTEAHNDLNEYVESIDDDLAELEETLFGEEELDDEDEDLPAGENEEDDLDEDDLIEYACPHCGCEIEFSAADVEFDEDFLCPQCHKPIFPEVEEDE